jgi:hypothetical protein
MLGKFLKTSLAITAAAFLMQSAVYAEKVTGKVVGISNKAKTIMVGSKMYRFDGNTNFIKGKKAIHAGHPAILEVDGDYIKSIQPKLAKAPAGTKLIKTDELCDKIEKGAKMMVVDSRPAAAFNSGHLPGAVHIDVKQQKAKMNMLPKDKNMEVVFYCGGPA